MNSSFINSTGNAFGLDLASQQTYPFSGYQFPADEFTVEGLHTTGSAIPTDLKNFSGSFSTTISTDPCYGAEGYSNCYSNQIFGESPNVNSSNWINGNLQIRVNSLSIKTITSPTIVYLDFGADTAAKFAVNGNTTADNISFNFNKQAASVTNLDAITAGVQSIFSKYLVDFVDQKPTSGKYDTIYVGGTPISDGIIQTLINQGKSTVANVISSLNGIAKSINVGNSDPQDSAVVFSGNGDIATNAALEQTIAHEAGHILGLEHVLDSSQLMYPYSPNAGTGISNIPMPIAIPTDNGFVADTRFQNSNALLGCYVGFSATGGTDCTGVANQGDYQNLHLLSSLASTSFDTKLIISTGSTDPDTGALTYTLGTLNAGGSDTISVPWEVGYKLLLEGSLTEGGPLQDLGSSTTTDGGSLTLTVTGFNASAVPEPSTWAMMIAGLGLVGVATRRKMKFAQMI